MEIPQKRIKETMNKQTKEWKEWINDCSQSSSPHRHSPPASGRSRDQGLPGAWDGLLQRRGAELWAATRLQLRQEFADVVQHIGR